MKKQLIHILFSLALVIGMMSALSLSAFASAGPQPSVLPENSGTVAVNHIADEWALTATPAEGWEFDEWTYSIEGQPQTSTDNPFIASDGVIGGYANLTANFKQAAVKYGLWVGDTAVTDKKTSGEGWSYDADSNTLTLDGATLDSTYHRWSESGDASSAVIYSENELNIVVKGKNSIRNACTESNIYRYAICCEKDLTIKGAGSLNIPEMTSEYGIYADGDFTINNASATVESGYYAVYISGDSVINNASVTATGQDDNGFSIYGDLTINSSSIHAEGGDAGIKVNGKFTINDSEVKTHGNYDEGIRVDDYPLEINNSLVQTSSVQDDSIYSETDVIMNSGRLETTSQADIGIYVEDGKFFMNGGVLVAQGTYGVYADDYSVYFNGGEATLIGTNQGLYVNKKVILSDRATVKAGDDKESATDVTSTFIKEHNQKWVHVSVAPEPKPAPTPTPTPSDPTAVGTLQGVPNGIGKYVVTSANTVSLVKAPNRKDFTVPAKVTINGKTFDVTGINEKAFKGTTVKILRVKTKKLTKASVKNSLKGSKVKTVKVRVGNSKANKKYAKKYKKIFKKKNSGKKVSVKK